MELMHKEVFMEFKYCCIDFENHIRELDRTGVHFLAKNYNDLNYFVLLVRIDSGTKSSVVQSGIKYCPYCGKQLKKQIKKQLDLFSKLVQEHKKYIID